MFATGINPAAWAQATQFNVKGIEVSAEADDGMQARLNAMAQAEKIALTRLFAQSMTEEQAAARVDALKPQVISSLVRGYQVNNEHAGARSYSATIDVQVDAAGARRLLNPEAAPAVAAQPAQAVGVDPMQQALARRSHTLLFLPVWTKDGKPLLFEPENLWRNAFNQAQRKDARYLRLPLGDQSDQLVADGLMAMDTTFENLGPLAERYQAGKIVVVTWQDADFAVGDAQQVQVGLKTIARGGDVTEDRLTFARGYGEQQEAFMQRVAQAVINRFEQQQAAPTPPVQEAPQQAYAQQSRLTILSRLNGLEDWITIRQSLQHLPMVQHVALSALSPQQVDMVVQFTGLPDAFEQALQQQGFKVTKAQTYWVVAR